MQIVVFDCETSGIPLEYNYVNLNAFSNARLLQLGYVIFDSDTQELVTAESLLCTPPTPTTKCPVADLYSEGKPTLAVKDVLLTFLSKITPDTLLVGHNIKFDLNIVLSEIFRLGATNQLSIDDTVAGINILSRCRIFCTYEMGMNVKLIQLYLKLFGRQFDQKHDAMDDAMATTACLLALIYQKRLSEPSLVFLWPDIF